MAVNLSGSVVSDPDDSDIALDLADQEITEDFTGAIVYCPVCATNDDAHSWGSNVFECSNCQTRYVVFLEPSKVHEHSMVG